MDKTIKRILNEELQRENKMASYNKNMQTHEVHRSLQIKKKLRKIKK